MIANVSSMLRQLADATPQQREGYRKYGTSRVRLALAILPMHAKEVNHPSHTFGTVDDCIRCLDCSVLYFTAQSAEPCEHPQFRLPMPPGSLSSWG